jgi:hypothetical protein
VCSSDLDNSKCGSTSVCSTQSDGTAICISSNTNILSSNQTPTNTDVWSKTSGYTVDDCYTVCEGTYDMEIQVNVCQGNCDMYGKPSASLDKYVNTVKDIKNRK